MANEISSANVAQAIVKLVAADALEGVVSELLMGNLVNRNFEAALAQAGDTVNIPIAPALSANNIAEAGTVTNQNPSLGNAQVVLNSHIEATFVVPDVTQAFAVPDLRRTYMDSAIKALAEKIEADILQLAASFNANTNAGTFNTALTEAAIDDAETKLFKAKCPRNAPWYLVVSSDAYADLRKIARFSEAQTIGSGQAIQVGITGALKGFQVARSQKAYKTGTSTSNLAFHRDALALVTRRLPQPLPGTGAVAEYAEMGNFGMRAVMSYQPNTLAQQFTLDVLYGAAILRNGFGVEVRS